MEKNSKSLSRFTDAQSGGVYENALAEICEGRKRGHWIWYILPQLKELGRSYYGKIYGISGLDEARAYAANGVLGARLREICKALLRLETNDPFEVMGSPDDLKLRSSMTLFSLAAPQEPVFKAVLDKFYNGGRCHLTDQMLKGQS